MTDPLLDLSEKGTPRSRSRRNVFVDARELATQLSLPPDSFPLMIEALTHPSAGGVMHPDNQRLEFLGDRVLGLVIAETLMARYPHENEGALSKRLNALVSRESCARNAEKLGLGPMIRMARAEALSGGRSKMAILGDAMEAVIAAVYRSGGIDAARRLILDLWSEPIESMTKTPLEPKTSIQEWAQGHGLAPPVYEMVSRDGPDHAPHFVVLARLSSGLSATGSGRTKRIAEQEAATALLDKILNTSNAESS